MPLPSARIALLQPFPAPVVERIRSQVAEDGPPGSPVFTLDVVADASAGARRAALTAADYAVVVNLPLTLDDLAAAERLRLVHKWGAGVDTLPLAALQARGIPVLRTAGTNARFVAELTLGLILSVLRNIADADRSLRAGIWTGPQHWTTSRSLYGRSVGLVGFGPTAMATATLLKAFGCDIAYTSRTRRPEAVERDLGVRYLPLADLLANSDVVSVHVASHPQTRGLIDAAALASMRSSAILVNVARGDVVDEQALVDVLVQGRIAGAGLDVFRSEPLAAGHPLLSLANVVLTPHVGGKVPENLHLTVAHWLRNIRHHATGGELPAADLVMPEP